tara:strand:- start:1073 stop:1219 length:147 start_codon:yes stop_codon:yes gene_type:complete
MFEPEIQREIIMLKAKDLEIPDASLDELDLIVCKMLGIDDPEPLILEI